MTIVSDFTVTCYGKQRTILILANMVPREVILNFVIN